MAGREEIRGRPSDSPHRFEGLSISPDITGTVPDLSEPKRTTLRPLGVLVVDDMAEIRTFLNTGLRNSGFAVWLASGGRAGVASYLKYRAVIDILLFDVRMPEWDGPYTLAAIRALGSEVPCCFMSGDTGRYTETHLIGLGAVSVFLKPFRLGEVTTQLRRLTHAVG